jgi:hypothetical protein
MKAMTLTFLSLFLLAARPAQAFGFHPVGGMTFVAPPIRATQINFAPAQGFNPMLQATYAPRAQAEDNIAQYGRTIQAALKGQTRYPIH